MHQPTTEPRPSIYYTYQVFQPWLPSAQPPQSRHPVAIAGSGPAGMVTALELARHGVRCTLLEEASRLGGVVYRGPLRDGVLEGDVFLTGGGDPRLVHERLWQALRRLQTTQIPERDGPRVGRADAAGHRHPEPVQPARQR